MDTTEITKYLDMAKNRKYWILIPLLLSILVGLAYGMTATRIYKAETTILVVPQRVPETYVRSLVNINVDDRLQTIRQQVMSRSNLEEIMREFRLFYREEDDTAVETKVVAFRKRIGISVTQGASFSISFEYEDPKTSMEVVNRLASNFIKENLNIREERVLGTSQFLRDELDSVKAVLEQREKEVSQYREKFLGQLPENLTANLNTLNRLQNRLEQLNANMREAEQRRVAMQQQLSSVLMMEKQLEDLGLGSAPGSSETGAVESAELRAMRQELSSLQVKYTENHPDVVRLRKIIEKMEAREAESEKNPPPTGGSAVTNSQAGYGGSMEYMLKPELERANLEVQQIKAEIAKLKGQIAEYERIVENTPKREQEMLSIRRDYDNLKSQYDSLLQRKLESEIALSMEKKQKGEQFRIIDPAKFPERPVRPDLLRVFLVAVVLGLGIGGGAAYLKEFFDTSFKSTDEIESELQLPVLAAIPMQHSEKEIRRMRRRELLRAGCVGVGFALSAVAVVLTTKGFDKTFGYLKSLIGLT